MNVYNYYNVMSILVHPIRLLEKVSQGIHKRYVLCFLKPTGDEVDNEEQWFYRCF